MLLFSLLTYAGIAAAFTCRIIDGPANCRSCPAPDCAVVKVFPESSSENFDCVWRLGAEIGGRRRWGWSRANSCFVTRARLSDCSTDPRTGPECKISVGPSQSPTSGPSGITPTPRPRAVGGVPHRREG